MMNGNIAELFRRNERLATVVNHLLAGLMVASLSLTVAQLGERVLIGWQGDFLAPLVFIVAIEAMYSRRFLRQYYVFDREWWVYRLSEWVVLLLLVKLALYSVHGFDRLLADIPRWQSDFLNIFFTDEYLVTLMVVFLFWLLAGFIGEELARLEGDEQLLKMERDSRISEHRQEVRKGLANLILFLGGLQIFMVALVRLDWEDLWGTRPPLQVGVFNLMAYFVLAMLLLSLTQFSVLRVRWSLDRIPMGENVASRWIIFSALFLLLMGVIAVFLPTRYSVGLLEILGIILSVVMAVISLLAFLLSLPFLILLGLLGSLFGGENSEPLEPYQLPEIRPPAPATSASWPEWIRSVLFWLVFLAVIGYSLYFYLSQNKQLAGQLRRAPVLGALFDLLRRLAGWLRLVNEDISSAVEARMRRWRERSRTEGFRPWSFLNLRRLPPRQRVIFYYLAMLRRGEESGLPRRNSQTPREYSESLSRRIPEVHTEVDTLTAEFMEARYSRHEITPQDVGIVQQTWQRIKRALRGFLGPGRE